MATREENLKKINDELGKLNDEELEKVAGGAILRELIFEKKKEQESNIDEQNRILHIIDEQKRKNGIIDDVRKSY